MAFSPLVRELFEALRCLPGIGPRSAQRMALHLLERDREGGHHLAKCLEQSLTEIGHCTRCRTLSEYDLCAICSDRERDQEQLCVVETPADMVAVEQSGGYRGCYFVLLGRLSPIDGIGPEQLGFELLRRQVSAGGVQELILATSATVEGEATAAFLLEELEPLEIHMSRIAHGIPAGGELDYLDSGTLTQALSNRQPLSSR